MDPLLTVIIPAYNVENYVSDAVQSALESAEDGSVRVLVVNDGSQDRTLDKVREILSAHDGDNVVSVVDQPNHGVSAARNAGLDSVTTPFVGFLDADDMFTPDFGATVVPELPRLISTDVDVVEFNSRCFDESGREAGAIRCVDAETPGTEMLDAVALQQTAHRFNNYLWCRIFRTSLFDGVRFPVGHDYEDVAVVPALYARARRVRRLELDAVIRRYRAGSIMRTPSVTKARDWLACHRAAVEAARTGDEATRRYWSIIAAKCFQGLVATVVALPAGQWREGRGIAADEASLFLDEVPHLPAEAISACETALEPVAHLRRWQMRHEAHDLARVAIGRSAWLSRIDRARKADRKGLRYFQARV